jgi:hypothetical protein
MVAEALKRHFWPVLAAVALVLLITLALTGERPSPGVAPFEPQGLMRHMALESVDLVELDADGRQWAFQRTADGTWRVNQGQPVVGFKANLTVALKLLRNSGPDRMLTRHEVAESDVAQFGLEKPRLHITVHFKSGEPFVISFGSANAFGSVRYAQVKGSEEIALLPAFAAEAWERLAGLK